MGYKHKDYPELSWSLSKMNTLKRCPREYFYDYYQSYNGWEFSALDENKQCYTLKKLSNRYLLSGNIIHSKIKELIVNNTPISLKLLEEHTKFAIENFRYCCIKSNKYKSNWTHSIKDFSMLREYFYNQNITKDEGEFIKLNIKKCLSNFVNSKTFKYLQINNPKIIEIEEFKNFYIENIKVSVKLDLLYKDVEEKYTIVDWKTGKEDINDFFQMLLYAKYVHTTYNVDINSIICRLEYLSINKTVEYTFQEADFHYLESEIELGMSNILDYVDDKILNKPKDIGKFIAINNSYNCRNCRFISICSEPSLDI